MPNPRVLWLVAVALAGCSSGALKLPRDGGLGDGSASCGAITDEATCKATAGCAAASCCSAFHGCYATNGSPPVCTLACLAPTDMSSADTCAAIQQQMQQYIDAHGTCQSDGDCATFSSSCGLPGSCGGGYLQQSAVSGLTSFEDEWQAAGCMAPCPPCHAPFPAACIGGICQAGSP